MAFRDRHLSEPEPMQVVEWLESHFREYRKRSRWSFLWRLSVEALLVTLVLALALKLLVFLAPRPDLPSGMKGLVAAVILAPFFETLCLQSFPVMMARTMGFHFRGQLMAAWIPFAALHFGDGVGTGICAGVVGGLYIAFTYAHWRGVSFRSAFWMTSGFHAMHNLVPALVLLALKR